MKNNEVLERYLSFCEGKVTKDKFAAANADCFRKNRETEKAVQVNYKITDLREFDETTGERIYPDGIFNEDTYIIFWCPKKLMGWEVDKIPYWFVAEKIKEVIYD